MLDNDPINTESYKNYSIIVVVDQMGRMRFEVYRMSTRRGERYEKKLTFGTWGTLKLDLLWIHLGGRVSVQTLNPD